MTAHNGDFTFEIKDKKLTICYDWLALSALSEYEDAVKELSKPLDLVNPERVAEVMSCGLLKHHPELDKEAIIQWSPPLMRSIMVIDKALSYAYFGNEGAPKETKKKVKTKRTILQKLFGNRTE